MAKKTRVQTPSLFAGRTDVDEGYLPSAAPNAKIGEFMAQYLKERSFDAQRDHYDVTVFDRRIETSKTTAIYYMHTYWSKKPHDAIEDYITHYTNPGDVVLDPFAGSGGVGVACRRSGRHAILGDLSQFCTFLSSNYSYGCDPDEFQHNLEMIVNEIEEEFGWIYDCIGIRTEGFLHSDIVRCVKCRKYISVADCKVVSKSNYSCPNCGDIWSTRSNKVQWSGSEIWGYFEKSGNALELVKLDDSGRESIAKNEKEIAKALSRYHLNSAPIPQALLDLGGRLTTTGTTTIEKLYSVRSKLLISTMLERIDNIQEPRLKSTLRFALSSILLNLTLMYQYRTVGGGKPGGGGSYYVPPVRRELSFFSAIRAKANDILKGLREQATQFSAESRVIITTEDAYELVGRLPSNSIDYIFTDPPYADTMPYGALNCVWDYWLFRNSGTYPKEILGANWRSSMAQIAVEWMRTLKPGRFVSLCYHDTSEGTWEDLQDVMALAGFVASKTTEAVGIETGQKSYQQLVGDKVVKRDLVITFSKPRVGFGPQSIFSGNSDDNRSFHEKARIVVVDFLSSHPGATRDRIYDHLVSGMVQRGEMERHDFSDILDDVAYEVKEQLSRNLFEKEDPDFFGANEVGRWYLKSDEHQIVDDAESEKEFQAAVVIEDFIKQFRKRNHHVDGVHYSDIFQHYVHGVTDKPRRPLIDWISEFFYITDEGTYRLPQSDEEREEKTRNRNKGTNRRIKRYVSYLEQGIALPAAERQTSATLAEWIRHCKRNGMYEYGKRLYEQGGLDLDKLSEEGAMGVEEDYQVCVRKLNRG